MLLKYLLVNYANSIDLFKGLSESERLIVAENTSAHLAKMPKRTSILLKIFLIGFALFFLLAKVFLRTGWKDFENSRISIFKEFVLSLKRLMIGYAIEDFGDQIG